MTEQASLPYIDLGCDPAILRQYALEHFGKKISIQAKDDTVVDRFREIYKEETGITLADIKTDDDGFDFDDDDKPPVQVVDNKPKPIAATINVQDDPIDPHPITGSVQFVPYRIVRNVDVRVSIPILNSLKSAVRTIYNPDTMLPKDVPTYPFSIIEYHY